MIITHTKTRTSSKTETLPPIANGQYVAISWWFWVQLTLFIIKGRNSGYTPTVYIDQHTQNWNCDIIWDPWHSSISDIVSELEALAVPWRMARKVTALGELEKQRTLHQWYFHEIIHTDSVGWCSILLLLKQLQLWNKHSHSAYRRKIMIQCLMTMHNTLLYSILTYNPFQTIFEFKQP